ncbi:TPA: hypothetical protein ACF9H0_002412 [Staphylococcus aureus]|uniref:hypothetical protein n=1 Tax=Staphylococcus aureus TaxID=1280 RepID=UPI0020010847|nr:hypothetical protein [Staphylococcus aureus]HDE9869337.1 hypothetical protein [Staphylococcus aureus]HDF1766839.1 hypothetical protein [Staphylococcus aureus]HDF4675528.1 hypothetical protein [Staphylococcus aureus]HDF6783843.1 hypothetical protein [Staphylococcus aureus]
MTQIYDVVVKTNMKGKVKRLTFNNKVTENQEIINDIYKLLKKHDLSFSGLPVPATEVLKEEKESN